MNDKTRDQHLVDRIGKDFYQLEQQLDMGLQMLLELGNVPVETRKAVGEYMRDVIKGVGQLEAQVGELAGIHRSPEPGLDPKEHGHATVAGLAQEIRQDEAAKKAEDRSSYETMLQEKAAVMPVREEGPEHER